MKAIIKITQKVSDESLSMKIIGELDILVL